MTVPQMRSSQMLTTFGPGAMADLPEASVIIGGLDQWSYDPANIPYIEEPRLVAKLKRILKVEQLSLRQPPPAADRPQAPSTSVTVWRFPEWFIVQHPKVMPKGYRRRQLVKLDALENGRYRDPGGTRLSVVPVRFVRACKKGHVGDIAWSAFVHGSTKGCVRPMWLEERGTSGILDEIWVVCECGLERTLSQAARLELKALGSCNGSRPWLGAGSKESCGEPNRLLIRSASNSYFPQVMSVISIPDTSRNIDDLVRSAWNEGLSLVDSADKLALFRQVPKIAEKLAGLDDAQIMTAIQRLRLGGGADRSVKEVEFAALSDVREELGEDVPDGDFFARALPKTEWDAPWMKGIQGIILVHRLREVVAQVGFTRFEAAGPDIHGELRLDVKPAPLALDANWLPAAENRGEGIFIRFDSEAISRWLQRPAVQERGNALKAGFNRWKTERDLSKREFPGLPYYMLHSFAHLLLTTISLECGYPASSVRERVYADSQRSEYGILLYTGSQDAEGTLGGLVQAARRIKRHVLKTLDASGLCSNDPVCANHSPVAQHDSQPLHGCACHGCLLVAETSCEHRNEFLDRALVRPTIACGDPSFFSL